MVELRIFNQEDRLLVAQILIKNGYTVSQTKKARSTNSKSMEYFLKVSDDNENTDTSMR